MDSRQVDAVRFGDFALDYGRRQLLRAGGDVHLSPKAYQLLTLLVTNRPKAVSRTHSPMAIACVSARLS